MLARAKLTLNVTVQDNSHLFITCTTARLHTPNRYHSHYHQQPNNQQRTTNHLNPLLVLLVSLVVTMASSTLHQHGGMPLTDYSATVPPGWQPDIDKYPFSMYRAKLKIWQTMYKGATSEIGALITSRLRGEANRIALKLKVPRPASLGGGYFDVADGLAFEGLDANPLTGEDAYYPGVMVLMSQLQKRYGLDNTDKQTVAADSFLDFR